MFINYLKDIIELLLHIGTLLIAIFGLGLWRKQLKGGDLYSDTKEALSDLRKLINMIDIYRYIYFPEAEKRKYWNKISKQYSTYEKKLILLKILSKDKFNDYFNEKCMKDYLTLILKSEYKKQYLTIEAQNISLNNEERKEIGDRLIEIDNILKNRDKDDKFGIELENYYNEMLERLKINLK